jgi:transposase
MGFGAQEYPSRRHLVSVAPLAPHAPCERALQRCRRANSRRHAAKPSFALGHKKLRIIFAMLSNQTPHQDRTVDYEALLVERNAPRWIKMLKKHGFLHAAV